MKKTLSTIALGILIFCSIAGIVDAGYLTCEKFQGQVPPCTGAFKCGDVLNSSWSSIGPVPVSLLGVGFYLTFLLLASLVFVGTDRMEVAGRSIALRYIIAGWSMVGLITSLILVSVMAFVLQSWCIYCLLSAANSVILFVVSSWYVRLSKEEIT